MHTYTHRHRQTDRQTHTHTHTHTYTYTHTWVISEKKPKDLYAVKRDLYAVKRDYTCSWPKDQQTSCCSRNSAAEISSRAMALRRPNKSQKRPTIGAKETYYMRTFESLPLNGSFKRPNFFERRPPHTTRTLAHMSHELVKDGQLLWSEGRGPSDEPPAPIPPSPTLLRRVTLLFEPCLTY